MTRPDEEPVAELARMVDEHDRATQGARMVNRPSEFLTRRDQESDPHSAPFDTDAENFDVERPPLSAESVSQVVKAIVDLGVRYPNPLDMGVKTALPEAHWRELPSEGVAKLYGWPPCSSYTPRPTDLNPHP